MAGEPPERLVDPALRKGSVGIARFEHGSQILSNFQWLEDDKSDETKTFLRDQENLTMNYLKTCPEGERIKTFLKNMAGQARISCPTETVTGHYYFFINEGNGSPDSLYVQDGIIGNPKLFLSPNQVSSSGCFLRMFNVSKDGKVVAYAFSLHKESRWLSIRFKATDTGKDYSETLKNVRDTDIAWTHDGKGIFYSCYSNPRMGEQQNSHKIVFHRIGTDQMSDLVFVEFPHIPSIVLQAQISDCGEMLFVYAEDADTHNYFIYGDLRPSIQRDYETTPLLYQLLDRNGLEMQHITNINGMSYFRTNCRAPNCRIVKTTLVDNTLTRGFWETIIPEDPKRILDWVVCIGRTIFVACYLQAAKHCLELYSLDGTFLNRVSLPIGTITEYCGGGFCKRFFFTFTSFITPDVVYYIDTPTKLSSLCTKLLLPYWPYKFQRIKRFNKKLVYPFDGSAYCVKQNFCVNPKDGIAIPIFLVHKKRLKLNGQSPCIIYGQGCFGLQTLPSFSMSKIAFVQGFDGIFAIVGVRGGGEYGIRWYRDGRGRKKQTTYDDFIAASEFLIKLGYTSPSKLIIEGEYFGGNLAASCMIQRPDLYGAVIIHDGLLDLMGYTKFLESQAYRLEFENPDTRWGFERLLKISPLHNLLNENTIQKMPAVLAIVGNEFTLAHPSNSFKFIAELQYCLASKSTEKNPFLLYNACLGSAKRNIDERAAIFLFLVKTLGLQFSSSKRT